MSEAKFTKGVWSVGRRGSVISTESDGITINGGTGADADIYYGGNLICESVSDNNATLIAAAPELYDALNDVVDSYKKNEGISIDIAPIIKAKAVLSKARGEHK